VSETRVPFLDLRAQYASVGDEIRRAVDDVFRTQAFVLGPAVQSFEDAFTRHLGAAAVVGVASGTDALYLALRAAGIGTGDAVVTTPFSFVSTATAIARTGARPYFVDVEPQSFNLDPAALAEWLGAECRRADGALRAPGGERVRAVIPVHLFGRPCAMREIGASAAEHDLVVIEDAAQSVGARVDGTGASTGTLGRFGCFSFYPTKNLGGAGDGGAVACNDLDDAALVRSLARHGTDGAAYRHVRLGLASRLDALQAVVLAVKLAHLEAWNAARRRGAERYDRLFARAAANRRGRVPLATPAIVPGHVFHQYVVRVGNRDAVRADLAEAGIESQVYYPIPLHLQPCFAGLGYRGGELPEAERACDEVLALPLYPELGDGAAEAVVTAVVDAVVRRTS
jgi:dTDP-4-amino-4,6-dideoxygalactose transaminase